MSQPETVKSKPDGSPHYLDAECCECGWRDGIRACHWNPHREFWCDECNESREFRLCARSDSEQKIQ